MGLKKLDDDSRRNQSAKMSLRKFMKTELCYTLRRVKQKSAFSF